MQENKFDLHFALYYQDAMAFIENKKNDGSLVLISDLRNEFSQEDIEKRYNKPLSELDFGYTNSNYLTRRESFSLGMIDQAEVIVRPNMVYCLKEGYLPVDALNDILTNPDTILFIDCQGAVVIAQYYALLALLKAKLGDEEGKKRFNAIFTLSFPFVISRFPVEAGTTPYCKEGEFIGAPLNPLAYFIESTSGSPVKEGERLYYYTHSDYINKHPEGSGRGFTVLCVSTQPYGFIGWDIRGVVSEEVLKNLACSVYNIDRPSWMKSSNATYKENISPDEVQGFDSYKINFDAGKIEEALINFDHFLEKMKIYLDKENEKVKEIRVKYVIEKQAIKISNKTIPPSDFLSVSSFKSGFFNEDKIPHQLLRKYKLPDDAQKNIEKGLRNTAVNNKLEDLKIFIKHVKNINACDEKPEQQRTALHWAAERGHIGCLQALTDEADTNVNIRDGKQCTPLHLAAKGAYHDCYDYLIKKGADETLQDEEGKTALDYCRSRVENN